jgi:hypothetical protein
VWVCATGEWAASLGCSLNCFSVAVWTRSFTRRRTTMASEDEEEEQEVQGGGGYWFDVRGWEHGGFGDGGGDILWRMIERRAMEEIIPRGFNNQH